MFLMPSIAMASSGRKGLIVLVRICNIVLCKNLNSKAACARTLLGLPHMHQSAFRPFQTVALDAVKG